jgi:rod shape-determining protein MreD
MSERAKSQKKLFKILLLSLLLLITYVFDTVPFTLWRAVSPDLLVIFAITVSFFSSPLEAAVFSVAAGLFKDISSSGIFGFNAMVYLLIGVAVSLSALFFIRRSFSGALIVNAAGLSLSKGFYYFIFNVLFEKGGRIALLYKSVIPSILISLLFIPITYFVIKKIDDRFGEEAL